MADSAQVTVLLFAGARDAAGTSELHLELPAEGLPVEVFQALVLERCAALGPWLRLLRFAVNGSYAMPGSLVRPGDEVAVIPPVAGGSGARGREARDA